MNIENIAPENTEIIDLTSDNPIELEDKPTEQPPTEITSQKKYKGINIFLI